HQWTLLGRRLCPRWRRCCVCLWVFRSCYCSLTASTSPEIYTLSLHDALPIFLLPPAGSGAGDRQAHLGRAGRYQPRPAARGRRLDRKSTRLNSSHEWISYAVFCLKKKRTVHLYSPVVASVSSAVVVRTKAAPV